jgi:hypothetical protein
MTGHYSLFGTSDAAASYASGFYGGIENLGPTPDPVPSGSGPGRARLPNYL